MSDIKQHKQKKERGASVQGVIDSLNDISEIDEIAVVVSYTDGKIDTAFSSDSKTSLIGLLKVAKMELIELVYEEE